MPEGDTVWRTAQRLNRAFAGEPLTRTDLRWPGISTLDFTGATTLEVASRGKHLLHRLDSGHTIHSHLRMEGQWLIADAATARPNAQTRALLSTARWAALGQRLGMLDVVRTEDEPTLVGHLGPDLLGADWNASGAVANLASANTTIGAALLDQTNLAGVGTLYAAETLFAERLNPWTPTADLTDGQLTHLVDRAHRLLDNGRRNAVQFDHRQHPARREHLGARPLRTDLPALRRHRPGGDDRPAHPRADDVLLPVLPGRPRPER
ncbi:MAG: DNA-formamidopyrimidine glycosylase family protein [Micropruina sp.]